MWKGCLVLLAVLATAYFLERRELDRRGLPKSWIAAAALAIAVTLTAGTVQGLIEARRLKGQPETPPEEWRTGQLVRVGGRIRPLGRALRTPFTDREAVLFEYEASATDRDQVETERRGLVWRGIDMAPCVLETQYGRIPLTGFPNLKNFRKQDLRGGEFLPKAARKLASTKWKYQPEILHANLAEAQREFANENGELPVDRINRRAAERLELEAGEGSELHFLEKLSEWRWIFYEQMVAPGEEVTVVGTYDENPRRIDMSLSVRNYQHGLYPGSAAKTAAGEQWNAMAFLIVLSLITLAMHYAVYAEDGAVYRQFVQALPD